MQRMSNLYVGLMSGTSLDGVDAALVQTTDAALPVVLASVHLDYPAPLRDDVLQACARQALSFRSLGAIDIGVARLYATAVQLLLARAGVAAAQVRAVGAHGQTVHHEPAGDVRFTVQLGDPNTLAVLTGIPVVADFRRRDMALGGQGAPLAPAFHDAALRHPARNRIVLNCGGIANISVLLPGQPCVGYDTGPANILLDAWVQRHRGQPFDRDGAWALTGSVVEPLLKRMREDAYFALPAPKSTGRERFNIGWVEAQRAAHGAMLREEDVQRTLLELTASTVADAIGHHADHGELLVAGGGAFNPALLLRLQALCPRWQVASSALLGIAPDLMEAVAFAVFAQRTVDGLPGNLPAVTGASRPCLLGAVYMP
jgi:anhydro-N-acetylmuramic acid kinase